MKYNKSIATQQVRLTCSPESPVSSMETLSQEGSTERGVSVVTNARDKENNFSCSDTQEEKLFLDSVSSSLVISASCSVPRTVSRDGQRHVNACNIIN